MKKLLNGIKQFLKNDIVERCYKTFIQAFLGVLITINLANLGDIDYMKSLLIAAVSAGLSAVWNILKVVIDKKING